MRGRNVVVGVDGSPESDAALDFAIAEAAASGRRVRAVTAWWVGPALPEEHGARRLERHAEAERVQNDAVDRALKRAAEQVIVERVVTHGPPGTVLVHHARHQHMLVLGTKHKRALQRFLEGSVGAECIRHSETPVVIVPHVPDEGDLWQQVDRAAERVRNASTRTASVS